MIRWLSLVTLFCTTIFFLNAQPRISIRQFTTADGLSLNNVNALLQDSKGFIWAGTMDGLCRYDGYSFKTFKYSPDNPNSIRGNMIHGLKEDSQGRIWVSTSTGLSRYVAETESFINYIPNEADSTALAIGIPKICEDENGQIWVHSWYSCFQQLNIETGRFTTFSPPDSAYYQDGYKLGGPICPDPGRPGCLLVPIFAIDKWYFYSFDTRTHVFTLNPGDGLGNNAFVLQVRTDENKIVWYVCSDGLRGFDPFSRTWLNLKQYGAGIQSCFNNYHIDVAPNGQHDFWIASIQDGIYYVNLHTGTTLQIHKDEKQTWPALTDNQFNCIIKDRAGTIWAGSRTGGLFQFIVQRNDFKNIDHARKPALNMPKINDIITLTIGQDGKIWAGTTNFGIVITDPVSGQVTTISQLYPELAKQFDRQYIMSQFQSRNGHWWIGINGQGLLHLDPVSRKSDFWKSNPADSFALDSDYIISIAEDDQGKIWAASYTCLHQIDPQTGHIQRYYLVDPKNTTLQAINPIQSITVDKKGQIWVAAECELSVLSVETGRFRRVMGDIKPNTINKPLNLRSVYHDTPGLIWVSSNNGLYKLRLKDPQTLTNPEIRLYTEQDGLPSRGICFVTKDSRGRLWVSSNNGITLFRNPYHASNEWPDFKKFGSDDGLVASIVPQPSAWHVANGAVIIGGSNGFDLFYPDSISDRTYMPQVLITSFEKYDIDHIEAGPVAIPGIETLKTVTISYKNNIIKIGFSAPDFLNISQTRYAYRLLGFNDNWVDIGHQHEVTFTNLPPGAYTLEVRGSNSDGIWNPTPAVLEIVVTPPWWRTIWAYLAYAILTIAAIYGFVKARLRFLENRNRELEIAVEQGTTQIRAQNEHLAQQATELKQLDQLKSRFFANITHELRTPLTLMLGPLDNVLKHWNADVEKFNLLKIAQQNGRKLLQLISEILDLSKLDANRMTIHPTETPITGFTNRLLAQFDSHAAYLDITLHKKIGVPDTLLVNIDQRQFEMVVNNLLSNALKFTPPGGTVETALQFEQGHLQLTVSDTGRGIAPEDLPHVFDRYFQTKRTDVPVEGGTGIGLSLCQEIVRLNQGSIRVESQLEKGSVFYISWPAALVGHATQIPGTPDMLPASTMPSSAYNTAPDTALPDTPQILVVEDNPDLQIYIRQVLSPVYQVHTEGNGEAALRWLADHQPALILSDIMMPIMDGYQLLERLKNDDRYRHIPVIMLTARADIQDKLQALRIGVDDYLTKPFVEEELLARIENLLRNREARLEALAESAPTAPDKPLLSEADAYWLTEVEQLTNSNLKNDLFGVAELARLLNLSERQLQRRLREVSGLGPQQYIAEIRLQKARGLLEKGTFRTIAEVAYATGFGHPKVFTRAYRQRFGKLPSEDISQ